MSKADKRRERLQGILDKENIKSEIMTRAQGVYGLKITVLTVQIQKPGAHRNPETLRVAEEEATRMVRSGYNTPASRPGTPAGGSDRSSTASFNGRLSTASEQLDYNPPTEREYDRAVQNALSDGGSEYGGSEAAPPERPSLAWGKPDETRLYEPCVTLHLPRTLELVE
eukprot:gene11244-13290_t